MPLTPDRDDLDPTGAIPQLVSKEEAAALLSTTPRHHRTTD